MPRTNVNSKIDVLLLTPSFEGTALYGQDLRREPLKTRKATLASLLRGSLRAPRPRWRERIPARLRDGARRHRLEAYRFVLPVGSLEELTQVQEPGTVGGKARGGGGLDCEIWK
jgi:hypothetical protein